MTQVETTAVLSALLYLTFLADTCPTRSSTNPLSVTHPQGPSIPTTHSSHAQALPPAPFYRFLFLTQKQQCTCWSFAGCNRQVLYNFSLNQYQKRSSRMNPSFFHVGLTGLTSVLGKAVEKLIWDSINKELKDILMHLMLTNLVPWEIALVKQTWFHSFRRLKCCLTKATYLEGT